MCSSDLWILKQINDQILYKVFHTSPPTSPEPSSQNPNPHEDESLLREYFQLSVSINDLYTEWCSKDSSFASLTKNNYQGIRILKQDPVETIFTFICSANNNIARITQMVEKLCRFYGRPIVALNGVTYYDFPDAEKLEGDAVEKKLKEEKFGYRAGYIAKCAAKINQNGGAKWVRSLEKMSYLDARKQLQTLAGVGPKASFRQ